MKYIRLRCYTVMIFASPFNSFNNQIHHKFDTNIELDAESTR